MAESIKTGQIIEMETLPTLSDATAGGIEPGAITFEICRQLVDDYILVSEEEIKSAIIKMIKTQHILIEGASGVALAGFLKVAKKLEGKNVVIVLSGANIYWQNDTSSINGDDGIVTALEISNLNFSNTKLLTLSACETALGDINNNEGVYGLQRAFKIAGVKEMLITLWQVPDEETRQLMNLFYENVFRGDSYFNALRKAQIKMKGQNLNPAIWAGFELIGE